MYLVGERDGRTERYNKGINGLDLEIYDIGGKSISFSYKLQSPC